MINFELKNMRFYLNFAVKIYKYYDKLWFSIYNIKNLLLIYTIDHIKLQILGKSMVSFNVFINGKLKVANFYNFYYAFELEYNFFFVSIIEKVGYLILVKKWKIIIFDNRDNIALEAIRIGTNYLLNIFASKKTLALIF